MDPTFVNVDNLPEDIELNAYLPNNTLYYGTKTNTWKQLQVKTTNLLALHTTSRVNLEVHCHGYRLVTS
jgi:hypothetical protein